MYVCAVMAAATARRTLGAEFRIEDTVGAWIMPPPIHARIIGKTRLFFFFSSRRRHTRWPRDWSSDVCSSDLVRGLEEPHLPECRIAPRRGVPVLVPDAHLPVNALSREQCRPAVDHVDGSVGADLGAVPQQAPAGLEVLTGSGCAYLVCRLPYVARR